MAFPLEREIAASTAAYGNSNDDTPIEEPIANNIDRETPLANLGEEIACRPTPSATAFSEESTNSHQRLETLIEQQNALLMQQLQLAEKNAEQCASLQWQRNSPQDYLKTLDPEIKSLFLKWRKQFNGTIAIYISQSRKYSKNHAIASTGGLIQPFSRDAMQTWDWPEMYSSVAQPLQSTDATHAVDSSGPLDTSDVSDMPTDSGTYNVNLAFADLRTKHAWESQTFVLGHQKACVEKLLEILSLECQTKMLQSQVAALIDEQAQLYPSQAKPELEAQVKAFVEVVHRTEMKKADWTIKEEFVFPKFFLLGLRFSVLVVIFLAATTMSHESLMRCLSILFGLACGMALLWEDLLILSVRLLLGQSMKRMETYCAQATQINVNLPITFWQ